MPQVTDESWPFETPMPDELEGLTAQGRKEAVQRVKTRRVRLRRDLERILIDNLGQLKTAEDARRISDEQMQEAIPWPPYPLSDTISTVRSLYEERQPKQKAKPKRPPTTSRSAGLSSR